MLLEPKRLQWLRQHPSCKPPISPFPEPLGERRLRTSPSLLWHISVSSSLGLVPSSRPGLHLYVDYTPRGGPGVTLPGSIVACQSSWYVVFAKGLVSDPLLDSLVPVPKQRKIAVAMPIQWTKSSKVWSTEVMMVEQRRQSSDVER